MHFRAARFEFADERLEIFVEMIEGFPFRLRRRLTRGLIILKSAARFIPNHLILAQRSLNNAPMPQVVCEDFRLLFKLLNRAAHRKIICS